MSAREVAVSRLLGRPVRDADGRHVGRIADLRAEIVLNERGSEYQVVELLVGVHGWLEALAGGQFRRQLIQRVGRVVGYRHYRIPWHKVDLSDVEHPRLTCRREELLVG